MADILSLSRARKIKARARKDAQATENRIVFGRTKAEKQREAQTRALDRNKIDVHKRDE